MHTGASEHPKHRCRNSLGSGSGIAASLGGEIHTMKKALLIGSLLLVLTLSIGGTVALPRLVAYCSAKGAIHQLTRVLAVEWAPHHVLVNAIAPGFIETDLTKGLRESPKHFESLIRQVPLGRLGHPAEIVGAAIYLASDAASYVTGQMLHVDGGWLAL